MPEKGLYTPVHFPEPNFKISYSDRALFVGSCFSERIGNRMAKNRFRVDVNPTGTTYNPVSILDTLQRVANNRGVEDGELFQNQSLWRHFDFHSNLAGSDKGESANQINSRIANASELWQTRPVVIVTLGTAWAFRSKETGRIVNNCHQLPASRFELELLDENHIMDEWSSFFEKHPHASSLHWVFTVSPVRHTRFGAVEDMRSKANLISLAHRLTTQLENSYYWPVFEYFFTELRDYRFYAEDLVHPSPTAEKLVWENFRDHFIGRDSLDLLARVEKLNRDMQHKPRHPESEAHKNFLSRLESEKEAVTKELMRYL